jgi:hypothetical protein
VGNFDTVTAITANLTKLLKQQGAKFTLEAYEDTTKIPASILPHGLIQYLGEVFDQEHGQRPSWNEIKFKIRIVFKSTSADVVIRDQQEWMHKIRDNVTVNAMNIDDLASSKLVSWIKIEEGDVDNQLDRSILEAFMMIRYREL